jgi:hypothetical protein
VLPEALMNGQLRKSVHNALHGFFGSEIAPRPRMKISKIMAFMLGTLLFSSLAFADNSSPGLSLEAQGGLGVLSDGGGSHFELGAEGLYRLLGPISVGGYLDYLSRGCVVDPANGNTISASYLLYGLQGMFDLGNAFPNLMNGAFSLGARVGLARNARSVQYLSDGSQMNDDDTNFSIGPVAAYDVQLNQNWSAGGELNWQLSSGDNVNNVIGFLATLKYAF